MKKLLFPALFIYSALHAQPVSQKVIFPDTSKINSYSGTKTINAYGYSGIIAAMLWSKYDGTYVTQFIKTSTDSQLVRYFDHAQCALSHIIHGQHGASFILYGGDTSSIVSKIDSLGNVQWSKEYKVKGMPFEGFDVDAIQHADTLIVANSIAKSALQNADISLLMINAKNGGIIKQLQLSIPNSFEEIVAIKQTNDRGAIILARSRGGLDYYYRALVIKLDKNLDIEWTSMFRYSAEQPVIKAADIIQVRDSGYVICGAYDHLVKTSTKENAFLLKLDRQGTVLWNKAFKVSVGNAKYYSVCETSDGKLVCRGNILNTSNLVNKSFIGVHAVNGNLKSSDTIVFQKDGFELADDYSRIVNTTGNTFVTFSQYTQSFKNNTYTGGINLITGRSDGALCNFAPIPLSPVDLSFQLVPAAPAIIDITQNARQKNFSFTPDNMLYKAKVLCTEQVALTAPNIRTGAHSFSIVATPNIIEGNTLNLKVTSTVGGYINILIKTETSNVVYNEKFYVSPGTTLKQVTIQSTFKGAYFIQAILNNEVEQLKFFKR